MNKVLKFRSSLGLQLTAWYGLSSFILVLLSTGCLYWWMESALRQEASKLFEDKLQTIRLLLSAESPEFSSLRNRIEKEWIQRSAEKFYVRIEREDGQVISATPGLNSEVKGIFESLLSKRVDPQNTLLSEIQPTSNTFYRTLITEIRTPKHSGRLFQVELILDSTDQFRLLRAYRTRLYVVLSVALLFCLFIGRQIASRGLRPVLDIAEKTNLINPSHLDQRINTEALPIEIAKLASNFNKMLNRLEDSFKRLSQFSADISHELRMPVTNMSGEIEVTLGKNRTSEYYQDVLGSCLEECERLSHIIDSLLFLARCENPKMNLKKERMDVERELEGVLEFYEAMALDAGIELNLKRPPKKNGEESLIDVERTLFQRAVGNLLSNAIKNTPRKGKIFVQVEKQANGLSVTVRDTGVGISQGHLTNVMDRFYRVDASRSKDSGGTGLGLSIVKSIAALHNGDLTIDSEPERGTSARLWFPLPGTITEVI